jgi:hypothetical protein
MSERCGRKHFRLKDAESRSRRVTNQPSLHPPTTEPCVIGLPVRPIPRSARRADAQELPVVERRVGGDDDHRAPQFSAEQVLARLDADSMQGVVGFHVQLVNRLLEHRCVQARGNLDN